MESNSTYKLMLGLIILLLGTVLGFQLHGLAQPLSNDGLRQLSERMNAMESRLDSQQQMMQRAIESINRRATADSSSGVARGGSPVPPLSPVARDRQMQLETSQSRKYLDQHFDSLTPAPPNDQAPQRVNDAFLNKDVLQAPELPMSENVDCRSTMCLIRARFAANQDGSDWTNRLLLELGDTLPSTSVESVPVPGGGVEVRIYATRTGERDPFGGVSARP
jgi:hypothetical protein